MQNENDYFTALNDDCIFEVFRRLPIDDLGAVGRTCKKLKELAGNYIQRRHPELIPKSLTIAMRNGIVNFDQKQSYIKCVSQCVETIEIILNENDSCDRFVQFIQVNCGKNVNKIKFFGTNWTKKFGKGIKYVLRNVPNIEFYGCTDNFDHILTKCQSIKHLVIYIYKWEKLSKLPFKNYPSLETFQFDFLRIEDAPWNQLATFFQRNQNVKRFVCMNFLKVLMIKHLLAIIIENGNIEELFIDICMAVDFGELYNEFKMLADRPNFKSFELKLSDESTLRTVDVLASLKSFTGLSLGKWSWSPTNLSYVNPLKNLKVLRLDNCNLDESTATAMALNLDSLEEFHYRMYNIQVKECIKPFVRYAKKLTEMDIICDQVKDNHNDMPKLNDERRKLADARKLIIFIRELHFVDWNKQFSGVGRDMVDIQITRDRQSIYDFQKENLFNYYELD